LSVASMSEACSGVGVSLQTTVRVISIRVDYLTSIDHIQEGGAIPPTPEWCGLPRRKSCPVTRETAPRSSVMSRSFRVD
jgi:hypothetical protein